MLEQIGPRRLWRELRSQAPYYAKMLPDLPRLLHTYLQQRPGDELRRELRELREEQRRTRRLLRASAWGGLLLVLALGGALLAWQDHWF